MELLEFKHQSEQDQFKLLVEISVDKNLQQEVLMMSQQQRKDQLSRLKSKHESTPMGIFIFICKICHKKYIFKQIFTSSFRINWWENIVGVIEYSILTLHDCIFWMISDKQKEHDKILSEGVLIKRELCRQRMSSDQKAEATDKEIHEALMAELMLAQNCEAERLLQEFMSKVSQQLFFLFL